MSDTIGQASGGRQRYIEGIVEFIFRFVSWSDFITASIVAWPRAWRGPAQNPANHAQARAARLDDRQLFVLFGTEGA